MLFAIVGAGPVLAGLLVRTTTVKSWAARETAALVERELGTRASYTVEVKPWPLTLALRDITVDGDDGGGPFLTVERASVRPRIFSLLAGKVDVGEIEVTGAHGRVVVRDGELVSLRPKTPEAPPSSDGPSRPPFSSLAITDANFDLDVDGVLVSVREVDLDVNVEQDGALEIAARSGSGILTRKHPDPRHPDVDSVDEDRLCKLEARARFEPHARVVLVRRLAIRGSVDFDPAVGTRPGCELGEGDWRALDLSLGAFRVDLSAEDGVPKMEGHVALTAPPALVHRFVSLGHATGSLHLDVDVGSEPNAPWPVARGQLTVDTLGLDGKVFCERTESEVAFDGSFVTLSDVRSTWADGKFHIREASLGPIGPTMRLDVRDVAATGVELQGLLRDLGAHPQSHVGWRIDRVSLERFGGTLFPINLSGDLVAKTSGFGVYDRPSHLPDKQRMISVDRAEVTGTLSIRDDAAWLEKMHAVTPRSDIRTTVMLGFGGRFGLDVERGTRVDLGEISPLVSVDIAGKTTLSAHGSGTFDYPRIEGDFSVDGFELGGFSAGDIQSAHGVFVPLKLELTQVELRKNESFVTSARTLVAFDAGPDVMVDSDLETTIAPHLQIRDFFEVFELDRDPRFDEIAGTAIGSATVHYALGGAEDRCGGGALDVKTRMKVERPDLFGETFDRGELDVRFRWDDHAAGSEGMVIDVPTAIVQDGTGSIVAQATVRYGGLLTGNLVAASLPLARLEGLGRFRGFLDGEARASGRIHGTLARPEATIDVTLSPIRFGANKLPASRLSVVMEPAAGRPRTVGTSRCGRPVSPEFNRAEWERDLADGQLRVDGELGGGQIRLEDLTITRQRQKVVKGRVLLSGLDIGTILGGLPDVAFSSAVPSGKISATIDVGELRPDQLAKTKAKIELYDVALQRGSQKLELVDSNGPLVVDGGAITVPTLDLNLEDASGLRVGFSGGGRIDDFAGSPTLDANLVVSPFELGRLQGKLASVDRIAGTLSGSLAIKGPLAAPAVTGAARLRKGALGITDVPLALDELDVDVEVGGGEARVTRATANVGAGTLDVTGRVPLAGLTLGTAAATITLRGVKVPVQDGVDLVADADLEATIRPGLKTSQNLPEVHGTVKIVSFAYARPIALSLDLGELSRNLRKTSVEAIDPAGDVVRFDVNVVSPRPLSVRNDLADVKLEIVDPGIRLAGTNQRYGAQGSLRLLPESKLRLRNHEFDVREGSVRFEDPSKVRAEIDVRATTEFRRYASSQDGDAADAGSTTGGQWQIGVHAHGGADDLKLDLESNPSLDQEDIVLLLTVGMTRAEIDRGLASSLGETVGLEALSALTGADKAVRSVVPIIDYFHFGSSYSSRTGRTEPNVTVGKRLTEDLRASVTTTLTERDVGASVEWRLKKGVSLQGSYDNTNDIGSIIGNLGADLRWRLEFE